MIDYITELKNKKVLVIGGMGFIGSSVVRGLVYNGADVTIMDSFLNGLGANYFNIEDVKDKVKINVSDIRDFDSLLTIVKGFDIIYNFAGQPAHNDSLENPQLDLDINLRGHLNLLQACKKNNLNTRILYAGSRMQIGEISSIPVNEQHPCRPKSPYGVNKQASEEYSLYFNREIGLKTVVFRISNPYGPRAQMRTSKYCIVNWFLGQLMKYNDVTIFGDGGQIRDYIFIDDLVNAFLLAGISPNAVGQVFHIGSGEGTKFIEMVDTLVKVVNKGKRVNIPWPENYRNIETGDHISDISKAKELLGWKPKISLEEGIKITFEFYDRFGKHYF